MSEKIIGRFYLKKTSNGNLVGEFSNDHDTRISTESCDLMGNAAGYFGEYHSTWQENGQSHFAKLTISPNGPHLFALKWCSGTSDIFVGDGMMCDEILIGNYQSA
jgi:hypothetical protein